MCCSQARWDSWRAIISSPSSRESTSCRRWVGESSTKARRKSYLDNLTHTLVGAALAEAGLKKRTALGAATLMIGANFPDIDVLALFFPGSIDVRRGATHGFPALAILPFVLAWLMKSYDRNVRLRRDPTAMPADFRQLALLSALAIWTHPTLDYMNTYGMRWLMPFVNKWFYADGLDRKSTRLNS